MEEGMRETAAVERRAHFAGHQLIRTQATTDRKDGKTENERLHYQPYT